MAAELLPEANRLLGAGHRNTIEVDEPAFSTRAGASRASRRAAVAVVLLLALAAAALSVQAWGTRASAGSGPPASAPPLVSYAYATPAGAAPFLCTGAAASLAPGRGNGATWRCSAGACIQATHRCDGSPNCLDQSDERGCPESLGVTSVASASTVPATAATAALGAVSAPAQPGLSPVATAAPAPAPPGSSSSNSISFPLASSWQPQPPVETSGGFACTEHPGYSYEEVWRAQGSTFFDNFNYLLNDENSGAVKYLTMEEATQKQVTVAYDNHAILRAGPKADHLKRASAKIETKVKWTYFLMAARFNQVPWGCGVWPAFWTHSPEAAWPNGGELDILEYSNEIASRSSFHVGLLNKCKLDEAELHKPGCPQYVDAEFNFTGDYQCVTHYPDMIGCAPNRLPLLSGEQMSKQPFVVAAEWTPSYVKLFRIPVAEMPVDLAADQPRPDEWDKWITAYYPFGASERNFPGSCPRPEQVMKAQQLVLSLGFCGDWAAKVWLNSTCASTKGPTLGSECVAVDPHNPMGEIPGGPRDCCTAFIYDEYGQYGTEEYLSQHGYFNVSWIKVYQPSGRRLDGHDSFV